MYIVSFAFNFSGQRCEYKSRKSIPLLPYCRQDCNPYPIALVGFPTHASSQAVNIQCSLSCRSTSIVHTTEKHIVTKVD